MKYISLSLVCFLLYSFSEAQQGTNLTALSAYRQPPASWRNGGDVKADLGADNALVLTNGTGVLANIIDKSKPGADIFSINEHGDAVIELDYMLAKGSNSGIYLQGRYEIQLNDSRAVSSPRSGDNGGIYERWDESRQGYKGYEGYAPRQNVTKSPGLWQHIKISFTAPRFDGSGKKITNARINKVELNGVVIHENVELFGPTRGAMGTEAPLGPLRFQGDHGAVAFRNIQLSAVDEMKSPVAGQGTADEENANPPVDPILVDVAKTNLLRSFMDIPGKRVVHAVSVGSNEGIHYTYDMDNGFLVQVWRGGFLDATPMWHERGDGSSRPTGSVQLLGVPALTVSQLASPIEPWKKDTSGSGYRPRGYSLDASDRPLFRYQVYGAELTDGIQVTEGGSGIKRTITVKNASSNLFARVAAASRIEDLGTGTFLVNDKSYYIKFENGNQAKAVIRESNGQQEILVPLNSAVVYSIIF